MASSDGKHNVPKDCQIIASMMKDLGIVEYDQQVLNHLLEFNYSNYSYNETSMSFFTVINSYYFIC